MKLEELAAAERMMQRMKNEVSRMNSAYDYYGMNNTLESIYPDELLVLQAFCRMAKENTEMRLQLVQIEQAVTRLENTVEEKRSGRD
jgi:hypothetical protein